MHGFPLAMLRSTPARRRQALPFPWAIATAGVLVGGLDFTACSLFWAARGVPPERIARSLAELLVGMEAYSPGAGMVVLGLAVQALVGVCLVLGYMLAAKKIPRLLERPLRYGMAYGAVALAVFELAVVPLSAAASRTMDGEWQLVLLAVYMIVLGMPAAVLAKRLLAARARRR